MMEKKTGKTYYCAKCNCYPTMIMTIYSKSEVVGLWDTTFKKYNAIGHTKPKLVKVMCKKCGFKLQER